MEQIISLKKAKQKVEALKKAHKTIALTGGCFDILHLGHIRLLEKAKQSADTVFVLLESDQKIKELKGPDKPFHTQRERAELLSSIRFIDYVITLPYFSKDQQYENAVITIQPDTIVTTQKDPIITHKREQAKKVGAKIVYIPLIAKKSTTKIAELLKKDL